jgi:S-adenosylmethionine:tRNA ribosyltransferase-isomerase
LWDVQNLWSGPPWAVEMPSAGRILDGQALLSLRQRGVSIASVTHAAGLSSTGDDALDAYLPLPERWRVPATTMAAVAATHAKGGRVIAVGTSVVRALETAARTGESEGVTDLLIDPTTSRLVVDGILTGVHDAGTSHFSLLGAFAPRPLLEAALSVSERAGFLSHELGDEWLIWGSAARGTKALR